MLPQDVGDFRSTILNNFTSSFCLLLFKILPTFAVHKTIMNDINIFMSKHIRYLIVKFYQSKSGMLNSPTLFLQTGEF